MINYNHDSSGTRKVKVNRKKSATDLSLGMSNELEMNNEKKCKTCGRECLTKAHLEMHMRKSHSTTSARRAVYNSTGQDQTSTFESNSFNTSPIIDKKRPSGRCHLCSKEYPT